MIYYYGDVLLWYRGKQMPRNVTPDDNSTAREFELAVDHAFYDALEDGANPQDIRQILEDYAEKCGEGTLGRDEAREFLLSIHEDYGQQYFDESEHQEGIHYWARMIEDMESLRQDFALYIMQTNDCVICGHDRGYFDDDDKLRCDECDEVQPV